jgi:ubiquinone/menaquinone biosynthesis C-methylase UbiE
MSTPAAAARRTVAGRRSSTSHAPKPSDVMKEIFRVLKPGGIYAAYEWCLTDKYDANNKNHVDIMHELAVGFLGSELSGRI